MSLREFFDIIFSHIKLLIITTLAGALVFGAISFYKSRPKYEASAQILINPPTVEVQDNPQTDSTEIARLISTSNSLLKNSLLLKNVEKSVNEDYGYSETIEGIKNSLTLTNDPNSQIISVKVEQGSAKKAQRIANQVAMSFANKASQYLKIGKIVVSKAGKPKSPISDTRTKVKNIIAGTALGFFIGFIFIFARVLSRNVIRTTDYITKKYNLSVIGSVTSFKNNFNK